MWGAFGCSIAAGHEWLLRCMTVALGLWCITVAFNGHRARLRQESEVGSGYFQLQRVSHPACSSSDRSGSLYSESLSARSEVKVVSSSPMRPREAWGLES